MIQLCIVGGGGAEDERYFRRPRTPCYDILNTQRNNLRANWLPWLSIEEQYQCSQPDGLTEKVESQNDWFLIGNAGTSARIIGF